MSGIRLNSQLLLCVRLLILPGIILGQENGPGVVKVVVEEGEQAVLPCSPSPKQNLVPKLFDWRKDGHKEVFMYRAGIHYNNGGTGQDEQFRGRVSHFVDQLKHGNASIIIRDTKIADAGNYTCDFPRLQPRQTLHIQLVVQQIWADRTEENKESTTAAQQPYIWTLDQTKDWSLLHCEVRGVSPIPQLEWQDSAENILPTEGPKVLERDHRYHVTLLTNVTTTGRYRCVVKQKEIHHMISADTYVYIAERLSESPVNCQQYVSNSQEIPGYIGCLFGGALIGALILAAIQAIYKKCITIKRNAGSRPQTNGVYKPPSETVTKIV